MDNKQRKTMRLPSWDYSKPAVYHVVFCTLNRMCILGRIETDKATSEYAEAIFVPSELGQICEAIILRMSEYKEEISIIEHSIMPNHIHLLVHIETQDPYGANILSTFIMNIRRAITHEYRKVHPNINIWQHGYYDRIMRDENECINTIEYIRNNPKKWMLDKFYKE